MKSYDQYTYKLERLDLMVAYSCNISCAGCISISDIKRSGIEPIDQLVNSIDKWKLLLDPETVSIFGGEPCLHPNLMDICSKIRSAWPNAVIRLITNGYLLDRFDPSIWFDFPSFEMQVSIHRKDHESLINDKIKNILNQRQPWKVSIQGGSNSHRQITWTHDNFVVYKSIFNDFVPPYKKIGNKFFPWHSDPKKAHKICGSPSTPILYKGKLYKCPAVANIIDITNENWFNYTGVDSADGLEEFVKNIGVPESVCGQCPDSSQAIIDHFNKENVIVRHKNIS